MIRKRERTSHAYDTIIEHPYREINFNFMLLPRKYECNVNSIERLQPTKVEEKKINTKTKKEMERER